MLKEFSHPPVLHLPGASRSQCQVWQVSLTHIGGCEIAAGFLHTSDRSNQLKQWTDFNEPGNDFRMFCKCIAETAGIEKVKGKPNLSLNAHEPCDYICQRFRVVLVHHMPCIVDFDQSFISNGVHPLLFVAPASLMTILAFDEQHGALDTAKKFNGLARVERLG